MHAESLRSANPLDLAHVHDLVDQALTSDNLMLLIRSGERLTMDAQAATVVLPVLIRDCLTEVVIMRAREIARPALEMMKAFVRLYRNFQALIVEGQVDGLTGLNNRKTLESALSSVIRATREANPAMANLAPGRRRIGCQHVFLAIIDIDHFKRINDTLGHLFGDEVIVLIARFMRDAFRNEDMLFRFGGEEFVAVLVADSELDARAALERFRHRVSEYRFPQLDQVTVSIGMVEVTAGDVSTTTLGKADQALYFSKTNGRNQTTSYEELCRIGAVHNDIETGAVELF
jgi:diguanylate cyclase (GGDEF)-like protein